MGKLTGLKVRTLSFDWLGYRSLKVTTLKSGTNL